MKGKHEVQSHRSQKKDTFFSRLTKTQRWMAAVVCVLAVTVLGVVAYQSLFVRPDLSNGGHSGFPWNKGEEYIDYGDGVRPENSGARKSKDFYTVLVLGRDTGGGGNTDTMLLASYDVTNQKATVMSIPRDTMVNVKWDVKKINSVYNYYGGGEKGIQALYKEISQLVGFEPDYQVVVEWEAVGNLVDAIGGVYFDNPYYMDYHDPRQDLVIEQEPGYRLLTGSDAMQVIRWRKNDANSTHGYNTGGVGDAGRMQLQQDFLKAVIKQMMTPKNVLNIGKISKVFQENVETDLSFQNILWFGKQAFSGGLKVEDVTFLTMPWTGTRAYSRTLSKELGYDFYLDYVVPKPKELLKIVNEQLSPFEKVFTLANLDIMSVNADGSLSSTTGYVEDQNAAKPPEKADAGTNETPQYTMDEFGNVIDPETGEILYVRNEDGSLVDINTGEIIAPAETPQSPPAEEEPENQTEPTVPVPPAENQDDPQEPEPVEGPEEPAEVVEPVEPQEPEMTNTDPEI